MTDKQLAFFQSRVSEQTDGCWLWTGARGGTQAYPYGVYLRTTAHRVAYEHFVGPLEDGKIVHHECFTTLCVNPAHLRQITQRENLLLSPTVNSINAAKTHCDNGHEFTPENTYANPQTGIRGCRTCKREWRWRTLGSSCEEAQAATCIYALTIGQREAAALLEVGRHVILQMARSDQLARWYPPHSQQARYYRAEIEALLR